MPKAVMTDQEWRFWEWIYSKWKPISYRMKNIVLQVMTKREEDGRVTRCWWPYGDDRVLKFERIIDDTDDWPYDREVIEVTFDVNGSFSRAYRYKQIYVERVRSTEGLCKMLGIKEER